MSDSQGVSGPSGERERRRHRRLDVFGQVQVTLVSRPMPAAVRDLSTSGIALETTLPIAPGARHRVLLRGVTGSPTVGVGVTAVRCTRLAGPRSLSLFLVGFAFEPLDRCTRDALTAILDEVSEFSTSDEAPA